MASAVPVRRSGSFAAVAPAPAAAGEERKKDASVLFTKDTQALFYNYKVKPVQRMLDFDYLCGRTTPSIAAIVHPGSPRNSFSKHFFGKSEIAIGAFAGIAEAAAARPNADVFINFASQRSAFESSMEALAQPTIRVVAIIAEGVPESQTKRLIAAARKLGKTLIGPATVGGVQAGAFKIGDTAGTIDNIVHCKLHRPGCVGFVSKSGGMSNEMYNVLSRTTDGIFEGIAIGGDALPGSTLADHALRFEHLPEVKIIVVLGEIGGRDEYGLVDALKRGEVTKPVVAWCSGTCAKLFAGEEVQFGHAGAKSGGEDESAQAKNAALREAGAIVPDAFEGLEGAIKLVYDKLVASGEHVPAPEVAAKPLPEDLAVAQREGRVRVPTNFVTTISDDRGAEPLFAGKPISEVMTTSRGVGDIVSLLWFKRTLPAWASHFLEMVLMLCADHGPCVSGAHNAIVAARAGKDIVSCVASGMLTIGPRFGGAVDGAARNFLRGCDEGIPPFDFVEQAKKQGVKLPGIGHRIKSVDNPDKRVELLVQYARENFPTTKYLDYALSVEAVTTTKSPKLILNVDGTIAALFLDLMHASQMFSEEEVAQVVEIGYLNGLFLLSRTIGLVGHALDQMRMNQPLYRHQQEDVLFVNEELDYVDEQ